MAGSATPVTEVDGQPPMAYHVAILPRGYVVIAGDDRMSPVICFSATSNLELTDSPQNALRAMLFNDLGGSRTALAAQDDARFTLDETPSVFEINRGRWDALDSTGEGSGGFALDDEGSTGIVVNTMLTTQWSQWNHFNSLYPTDPHPGTGYAGRAPVGCLPVAGGQLCKFYAWPPRGDGSHADIDVNSANHISGSFAAILDDEFEWGDMQDMYDPWSAEPTGAVAAVAEVMYELGVSMDIDYGSFVSGGSLGALEQMTDALARRMFYEPGSYSLRADNPAAFDATMRQQILAGQPAAASIPNHAVVVDGLSEEIGGDYFHINYGWGGDNDGWYQLSNINGDSLEQAVFGVRPRLIPLLDRALRAATNETGSYALQWSIPDGRAADTAGFRVKEGRMAATNFVDAANSMAEWRNYCERWSLVAPGYGGGTCFRIPGQLGYYDLTLADPVYPSVGSRLEFVAKTILEDDRLNVMVSDDNGETWQTLAAYTQTGWDDVWRAHSIDLSSFAGTEIMIRFQYAFPSGYYYGATGGVWLDNVSLSDVEKPRWTVLDDTLTDEARSFTLNGQLDGDYYYAVEANDGSEWLLASPFEMVSVDLAPELDVDGDGIPNGWEETYFVTADGADADADPDGDGATNWEEYRSGTNPLNGNSCFAMSACSAGAQGSTLTWSSEAGCTYRVWRMTGLPAEGLVAVATNVAATPPINTFPDPGAASLTTAFYRIEVE